MCAATSEMCASIMPHHVMRGASAASPPPATSKMQSCCPRATRALGRHDCHTAPQESPPPTSKRKRLERSYSRWERGSGERRAAAVCEGAGGGGERDGGADRKREGDARCMMMAWLIDLLWYYSHVSQEAIIRSVQFSSPSLVFFQQTSSSSASFFCTLLRRGFGESSVLVRNNPFSFQLGSTYLCKSMSCYAIYVTSTCMFPFSFLYI